MMRLYRTCFVSAVVVLLMLQGAGRNIAQSNFDLVIDVNDALRLNHFAWAFDNGTFVFLNNGLFESLVTAAVELPQPVWQTFNVETGVLTPGQTRYPLQPVLDADELAVFNPIDVVLPAPDNNLLAFASAQPNSPDYLTFANRATNQSIVTPLRTDGNPFFRSNGLKGNWSEEGNVFIYSQSSPFTPETIYFYMRVDESDLSNLIPMPFAPIIDGEVYETFDITVDRYLDMSARGDSILAIARRQPSYAEIPYLVVWTPDAATNSYRILAVRGEDICDASFSQNDAGVVILTRDGRVLLYQMATQRILVLPVNVTANCSFLSEFSPNGRWVAVADYATDQLGLIDIDAQIAQSPTVLFPPAANAGADQTLQDSDGDGIGELTFNGLDSLDSDGEIVSYVWSQGALQQPESAVQNLRFPLGATTFTLTVTDNDGLQDTDDVTVFLEAP